MIDDKGSRERSLAPLRRAAYLASERTSHAVDLGAEYSVPPEVVGEGFPCKEAAVDATSQDLLAEFAYFSGLRHTDSPMQPNVPSIVPVTSCLHDFESSAHTPRFKCKDSRSSISLPRAHEKRSEKVSTHVAHGKAAADSVSLPVSSNAATCPAAW